MAQSPMYPAMSNSPVTELSAGIGAGDTFLYVVNAAAIPAAPNLVTIGTGEDAEVIFFTGKASGNTQLTGLTRGVGGTTAKAWSTGQKVARYFTALDHDAFLNNIADHESRISTAVQATAANITYYVRTDGNDNNTGLANTAGGAFLTINKAISMLPKVINHTVTINVAAGTYVGTVSIEGFITKKQGLNLIGSGVVNVTALEVINCFGTIQVTGITATSAAVAGFTASHSDRVVFTSCVKTATAVGLAAFSAETSNVFLENCTASNQSIAIAALAESIVYASNISGTGNVSAYVSGFASYFGYKGTVPAGGMVAQDSGALVPANGVLNPWGDNTQGNRAAGELTRSVNGTSQSLSSGSFTKLILPDAVTNQKSMCDPANSRFVAPETGTYLFHARVGINGSSNHSILLLYLNGSQKATLAETYDNATGGLTLVGDTILTLSAGQVVEIYVYVDAATTASPNSIYTGASGIRIA